MDRDLGRNPEQKPEPPPDREATWIAQAKAGDETAFEQLVRAHERFVYTLAYSRLKNEQDAQDAAQEAFVRAYLHLQSFRGDSRFSTWMARITQNICTDMLRKKTLPTVPLETADEDGTPIELPIPDTRYAPETVLEKRELHRALAEALDTLPDHSRQILIMREIGGLSYEEMSQTLNLDLGTVKSRLSRARNKVCAKLQGFGNKKRAGSSKRVEADTKRHSGPENAPNTGPEIGNNTGKNAEIGGGST